MPYIGNSHVVGDHINNFKVLDDISSYTATFDGSSTDVVSTTLVADPSKVAVNDDMSSNTLKLFVWSPAM